MPNLVGSTVYGWSGGGGVPALAGAELVDDVTSVYWDVICKLAYCQVGRVEDTFSDRLFYLNLPSFLLSLSVFLSIIIFSNLTCYAGTDPILVCIEHNNQCSPVAFVNSLPPGHQSPRIQCLS